MTSLPSPDQVFTPNPGRLDLAGRLLDVDLVVFDKDGTLIDFEHLWGRRTEACAEQLLQHVHGDSLLRERLYSSLGYDPVSRRTVGDGPLATATLEKLNTIAAAVLYQHGMTWDAAEEAVARTFSGGMLAAPSADQLRPLGDVQGLFRALADAGVPIAIVTSDDRAITQATLDLLGLAELVSLMVCGDDNLPKKPAPDGVLHVCRSLGIGPERAIMVGDTITDLVTAARAGLGWRVGVLSGVGVRSALAPHADIIIDSISDIRVGGRNGFPKSLSDADGL